MLKFLSFGSGSSGNSYYLESPDGSIIIDAGIGIRNMKRYFHTYGINQTRIHAIFLTHDHTDHIIAVASLAVYLHVPVYATKSVHERVKTNYRVHQKIPANLIRIIEKDTPTKIDGFTVTAFDVPHDSADCSGYSISIGKKDFVIVTDCGHITDQIVSHVKPADYLVLETNYDSEMLVNGKYPYLLKKRIASSKGHLSNGEAADLLKRERLSNLNSLFLCHLSENNNTPDLVNEAIKEVFEEVPEVYENADFHVLTRRAPTGFFEL